MKKTDEKIINEIIELNDLGISAKIIGEKFGKSRSSILNLMKRRGIESKYHLYTKIKSKCKNCNKEIESLKSNPLIFCSSSCSATFSNTGRSLSKETKDKIRNSLKKPDVFKICKCGNQFKIKNKKLQKYCSIKCNHNFRELIVSEENRKLLSKLAKERHLKNDKSFGWQKRNNLKPSYPETIAIRFFEQNNIKFEREVKIDRYFADFIIYEKYIIEIDGQQHNKSERIESDIKKDNVLRKLGYNVVRIKYPSQNIREELKNIIRSLAQSVEHLTDIQEAEGS